MHLAATIDNQILPCCRFRNKNIYKKYQTLTDAFNSAEANNLRSDMTQNIKNIGCTKCYEEEESGIKSLRQVSNENFIQIGTKRHEEESGIQSDKLEYLEISLSAKCNAMCAICGPESSTLWQKHLNKYDQNPKWTLENIPFDTITHYKIHGGEPFLDDVNVELLKRALEKHEFLKSVEYATNCLVLPNEETLKYWKKVKKIKLRLSIDAYGELNKKIRYPSEWSKIEKNVKQYIELSSEYNLDIKVATTISTLNVFDLHNLHKWTEDNKLEHKGHILTYPDELCVKNLSDLKKQQFIDSSEYGSIFRELILKQFNKENYV